MKKGIYLVLSLFLISFNAEANNMLVQNVTTLGNDAVNKTIQVQFDISWDNSWRDDINYDAAWIFMKFKDANGLWQHVQLNPTGFVNGIGTANTVQVTNDKVGCWLYRTGLGSGTFNSTGMQLQWNYGLAGLTNVTGLEVRVFAVEMVYVPEGEFNVAPMFAEMNANTQNGSYGSYQNFRNEIFAPGGNIAVINSRLSPEIKSYTMNQNGSKVNTATLRVKGNSGIDSNSDGLIDNANYATGYLAFYCFKYELSEQQYADMMNTLTNIQAATIGIAGLNISLNNGTYYSSTPNRACGGGTGIRLLSFADWSGLRPLTILEFNKASFGPIQPVAGNGVNATNGSTSGISWTMNGIGVLFNASGSNSSSNFLQTSGNNTTTILNEVGSFGNSTSSRLLSGASYFGIMDLTGNAHEPVVKLEFLNFVSNNGDGNLDNSGMSNVVNWPLQSQISYIDMFLLWHYLPKRGFRYVRSAE